MIKPTSPTSESEVAVTTRATPVGLPASPQRYLAASTG